MAQTGPPTKKVMSSRSSWGCKALNLSGRKEKSLHGHKAQAMYTEGLQFRGSQEAQLGKRLWRASASQSTKQATGSDSCQTVKAASHRKERLLGQGLDKKSLSSGRESTCLKSWLARSLDHLKNKPWGGRGAESVIGWSLLGLNPSFLK